MDASNAGSRRNLMLNCRQTTEKKKDKTILERISTGDTTAVGLLAVIVFISGAAGILIIKRKGVKQHEK